MKYDTKLVLGLLIAGFAGITVGCGPTTPPVAKNQPTANPTGVTGPVDPAPPVATPPANADSPALTPPIATPDAAALPATPPEPPATPTETVKAEAGVAKQGRSLDEYEGLVVTPAKAYFAVREKAVFEIAIPGAYKLYRATEEAPLTFEEFKEKVLDPNKIKLPALPPGHTYEWNPEDEELKVRRPVK
jgi:hypothetical protein